MWRTCILELAYGDEALGNEVRDRMGEIAGSPGIGRAMTDTNYRPPPRGDRREPYMQAAAKEAVRRADGDAVQAVMGDDTIRDQIEAMSSNPEVLRQTQEQSEGLLKKVAAELVDGVKEYRKSSSRTPTISSKNSPTSPSVDTRRSSSTA